MEHERVLLTDKYGEALHALVNLALIDVDVVTSREREAYRLSESLDSARLVADSAVFRTLEAPALDRYSGA